MAHKAVPGRPVGRRSLDRYVRRQQAADRLHRRRRPRRRSDGLRAESTRAAAEDAGRDHVNSSGTQLAPTVRSSSTARRRKRSTSISASPRTPPAPRSAATRDAVRDAAGPRASAGHLPARGPARLDAIKAIPIRAQNGSIVHLGDFATFPYADLAARYPRRPQQRRSPQRELAPGSSLSSVQRAFFKSCHRCTTAEHRGDGPRRSASRTS